MGNEERRWEKMKQMKWSEEGRKREEKYKIEVRAEETNWAFQTGANISPGTSSLDVQGATRAAHCLATGWCCSPWEKHQKHRVLSQQLWCRRYAVILMSRRSSRRFGLQTFGRNIPACCRSSVLQVATNRSSTELVFNCDMELWPPAAVGPPLLPQCTTCGHQVCRRCFKFSRRNTKLINAFNQLLKNR